MLAIPDIVRVSKLDTQFCSSLEYTQHVKLVSGSTSERIRVRKEEWWEKKKELGHGTFGAVWLEKCIHGDGKGNLRAVKKVRKHEGSSYYNELEAIALFSHSKYEQCFVKSFGWYDDKDSIFIAMEYLPNGDLDNYLDSPLLESEGQHIVSQVLEGLCFMHENGFAHRDLKPSNILVVCHHPNWWVKIADFGISKRATGHTAFRTLTGTPAFAAPEVLGLTDSEYTNSVDIWSLSMITFIILTGMTLFEDQRRLGQYVRGSFEFPMDILVANNVSGQACNFIRSLMAPKSEDRPGAEESLKHPWFTDPAVSEHLGDSTIPDVLKPPKTLSSYPDAEASVNWSTQDQTSVYKPHASARSSTQGQTSAHKPHTSASSSIQGQTSASILHNFVIRQSTSKPITSTSRLTSSKDRVTIHREATKLLLDNGFDIKALYNEQAPFEGDIIVRALDWAARNDHEAVVWVLLEKGADVEAKNAYGDTALHIAARDGHEATVRVLLEKGADVEAKGVYGDTALHLAADGWHEAAVRVLLEKGADVEAKDASRNTALHIAARNGHTAVVWVLLEKGADVEAKDANRNTALHIVARSGHEAVIWMLLEKGADVEAKDANRDTALHLAVYRGHVAAVQVLLENGADVKAKDAWGHQVLRHATQNGNQGVVRVLLEYGADAEATDVMGRTALHVAIMEGKNLRGAVVRLLLEKGASVAAKDSSRQTALHMAAKDGHGAVVQILLWKGADVIAKDANGLTALDLAAREGHEAVVQMLQKRIGIKVKEPYKSKLLFAAKNGDEGVVRMLLKKGADIAAKDASGWTALHWAAYNRKEGVVRVLLENGADVATKDADRWTALHWAAWNGGETIVQMLLEKGADVTAKNADGWTALDIAAGEGHDAIVQVLCGHEKADG